MFLLPKMIPMWPFAKNANTQKSYHPVIQVNSVTFAVPILPYPKGDQDRSQILASVASNYSSIETHVQASQLWSTILQYPKRFPEAGSRNKDSELVM